jgi:hypothetical protein
VKPAKREIKNDYGHLMDRVKYYARLDCIIINASFFANFFFLFCGISAAVVVVITASKKVLNETLQIQLEL